MAALALVGCDSCESGGPVPFGLDGGRREPRPSARAAPEGPDAPPSDRSVLVARALPEGTLRADVEGASIEIAGETIRAVGAWDLDGDEDRDALVVTGGDAARGPRVLAVTRERAAFAAPVELASSAALAPGCVIERAGVRALGDDVLVAEALARCPADELGATGVLLAVAVAARGTPRVLERFVLRARERTLPDASVTSEALTLRAEDRDADRHADLVAEVSVLGEGAEAPAEVSLAFLDRPAGLARDAAEPEARIAALAQEARVALRRHPDRARALASRAIALWDALCRESGRARLEIGGALGLACGRSAGAGRALSVLAQAAARTGAPLVAIEALERLGSAPVSVRDAERDAARAALDALTTEGSVVHEGPALAAPTDRAPRLSALAFLTEDRLLLRAASPPRVVDLSSGAESAAEPAMGQGLAMIDPSGEHRVLAIERRCEGTVLVIGPVDTLGRLSGARTTASIAPRRAPPGAPCPDLTPALRADDDGWRALGWAPQGVLVARGTELRLVPLDLAGRPAGDPVALELGDAIPAPIAPGHATPDARAYAYAAPGGVVIVELAPARGAGLFRPADAQPAGGTAIDVAISPSGRRIAWIAGGRVRWAERATAGP